MKKNKKLKLKPINEQVIVITGASSGIGLATARLAAQQGAKLVLAARSGQALQALEREVNETGGKAISVVADVGNELGIKKIADTANRHFGGFDTWVNNAGTSVYGYMEDVPLEDMRHIFETNFWGSVMGSLEAIKHLKKRGGALINVGSTLSDRAIPIQGIYSASKHAIKGFTDSLRMEIEEKGEPISVSLIKPAAIDTPFTLNAKNYLESDPKHMPPVYEPQAVALTILHCARTPVRDVYVGWGGKQQAMLGHFFPRLADRIMEKVVLAGTLSNMPRAPLEDNGLERPSERLIERGNYPGHVASRSLYTRATLHPYLLTAMLAGAGIVATALMTGGTRRKYRDGRSSGQSRRRNRLQRALRFRSPMASTRHPRSGSGNAAHTTG